MTEDDVTKMNLPRKKYFRQRAHSNPLSDHNFDYPFHPDLMDWQPFYPKYFSAIQNGDHKNDENVKEQLKQIEVLDIGCGYGGLLIALSSVLPDSLILGLEIRVKVSDYVIDRIKALRESTDKYHNVACIRTNAMKHLPNFFRKGQLKKAFFLFPDPHFKRTKLKWRIISKTLLAEYAYVLAIDALVYTITDVLEVHEWMVKCFSEHPLFERVPAEELKDDPCYHATFHTTEEGKKVARNDGDKHPAVFRRIKHPTET